MLQLLLIKGGQLKHFSVLVQRCKRIKPTNCQGAVLTTYRHFWKKNSAVRKRPICAKYLANCLYASHTSYTSPCSSASLARTCSGNNACSSHCCLRAQLVCAGEGKPQCGKQPSKLMLGRFLWFIIPLRCSTHKARSLLQKICSLTHRHR